MKNQKFEAKDETVIEFGFYENYSKHNHPNKEHYYDHDGFNFSKMTYDLLIIKDMLEKKLIISCNFLIVK